MSQDYSPSLVTKNLVFCGDAAMKSAAGPATLLYDKVNNNNGTMYNGTCLDFDGSDDYVQNSSFTGHQSSSGTIVAWAKADVLSNYVFGVGGTTTYGASRALRLYLSKLSLVGYGSTNEDYNDFGPTLVTGQWYHFAYVWSGTSITGYVDGVGYSTTRSGLVTPTGTNVTAGQAPWGGSYFNGQVADARMYNVALSADNIKEIYDDSKVIIPTKNDASGGFVSQTNLIAWWPLTEGAGTIAYDGSGNGNDGTLTNMDAATDWLTGQTGAPQLVEGYNRPMLFDGVADYVNCGASNALVTGTSLSFSAWVLNYGTTSARVFQAQKAAGSTVYSLVINASSGSGAAGYVSCLTWNGTGHDWLNYNASIDDGAWHHLVMTTTASAQKLYVDGVSVASSASTFSNTVSGDIASIGSMNGTSQFLDGLINEVVLYNSELSLAQVQALAATGPNGGPLPPDAMSLSNSSDIVAYWRNDGNVTWADRSGNGYTGTVGGSPDALLSKQGINGSASTSAGRDNQGFPLKYKDVGAIGFNGVDDYITVADSPSLDGFTQFSISANIYQPTLANAGIVRKFQTPGQKSWMLYVTSGGILYLSVSSDGTNSEEQYSVGAITAGVWNDIAVTYNAGTFKAYINGVDVGVDANFSTQLSAFAGSDTMLIGNAIWAGYYHEGQLGNVRLYNRALTYAEIQQNYKSFKTRFGK